MTLRSNTQFLRLLTGRLVANIGDSMYLVVALWYVYDLSNSTLLSGVAGFLLYLPVALQFLTGPIVDRAALRRLLVSTQLAQIGLLLVIPLAILTDYFSVWIILTVIPVAAIANQFMYPAQNAALPRLVEKEELVDANSLFSIAYGGVNLLFNAVGGLLIGLLGTIALFSSNAAIFLVSALLFTTVRIPDAEPVNSASDSQPDATELTVETDGETTHTDTPINSSFKRFFDDLVDGIEVIRNSDLGFIILGGAVADFALGIATAVLPAFAATRGGPEIYGLLVGAMGVGAVLGSIASSPLQTIPFGRLTVIGFFIGAVALVAAILSPVVPATIALYALAWTPFGIMSVLLFALIQSVVSEDIVGRVSSTATSLWSVMLPIGSLLGGIAGEVLGPDLTMAMGAVTLSIVALYFLSYQSLRSLPPIKQITAESLDIR